MSTPVASPPFNELQKQMFSLLNERLSTNVYDNVPESTSKPWITIGEVVGVPDYFHGGFGWDILISTHVWVKALGFKSAITIANEIIALLDHQRNALNMPSPWSIVSLRFVQMQTLRDPDPEIRHVPVQFRIVIHQEV
jgi:hypothetical protein